MKWNKFEEIYKNNFLNFKSIFYFLSFFFLPLFLFIFFPSNFSGTKHSLKFFVLKMSNLCFQFFLLLTHLFRKLENEKKIQICYHTIFLFFK